jgi:uncharacterized protein (DUF58 family)
MPLLLVLGLIFGLVILGVATLQSGVLILAIPFMAYLFIAISRRPEEIRLTVTREISADYVPQGTPITVKLTIMNQGPAIDELAVQDVLPSGVVHIEGKTSGICFLARQGKMELEYTIEAHRGEYNVYEVLVYARDSLDFFEQSFVYQTSPHLVTRPRYPKLNRIKIRPPQTRGFAGPIAARQGGIGLDFWGVREYQIGDPQRQINWKLAARSYHELYVNVFEQERVADVGIILDARQRTNVIIPSGSLFEHSVHAAAALAENFLGDGNRVSLLVYGPGMARVFPGYGRIQQDRILRVLSKVQPGTNYALESLAHLPTRLFPAKSQLVIVSPLVPEDVPAIVRMRAHGYAVMVISPDPISYESAAYQDSTTPAYRMAYAERHFILRQLLGNGTQIVDWLVDQPLEGTIRNALARQPLVVHNLRTRM